MTSLRHRQPPRPGAGPRRRRGPVTALLAASAGVWVAVALTSTLVVASVSWALAAGSSPSAAAPNAPATEPPAGERFALTPTGPDPTVPGKQTSFSYQLAPGGTAADRVTLFNYADHATAFQVYANDALDTAQGQLDLKRIDQKPTDAGAWVKVEQAALVVPANSAAVIPFVVVVPKGASPGDHAAGILASIRTTETTGSGQQVQVEDRVGVPLYVRVAGPLHPALKVEDVQSHYDRVALSLSRGTLNITYQVVNTGNVRLAGHQHLDVDGPFGWVLSHHAEADLPELLPGASVSGHALITGVLPAFRVTSQLTVVPYSKQGKLDPPPPVAHGSASVWAIPWLLLILLAAVVAWIVVRVRRRRGAAPPSLGQAPSPGSGSPEPSPADGDPDPAEPTGARSS